MGTAKKEGGQQKQMSFIVSSKGGVGKSMLAFLLAEKNKDALIFDIDASNSTISKNLAYRKPERISFKNEDNMIDRGMFTEFLKDFEDTDNTNFIMDFGGAECAQFLELFKEFDAGALDEYLKSCGIDFRIICVVAGADNFETTMNYLKDLTGEIKGRLKVCVAANDYFKFQDFQLTQLKTFAESKGLEIYHYNLAKGGKGEKLKVLRSYVESGKGMSAAHILDKGYFTRSINELAL